MTKHERARRGRVGRDPAEAVCAAHPVGREPPDLPPDIGLDGRDGVVVLRVDAHDARPLSGAEVHREDRAEHDRYLSEDVPDVALTEHALNAVDGSGRFDATLEYGEQRAILTLVCGVLARHETDVCSRARKSFTRRFAEAREDANRPDLIRRHHVRPAYPCLICEANGPDRTA